MKSKTKVFVLAGIFIVIVAGIIGYRMVFVYPQSSPTQSNEGKFAMRNKANGKLIRPAGAQAEDGVDMEVFTPRPWTCVVWQFLQQQPDVFILENIFSGKTFSSKQTTTAGVNQAVQIPLPSDRAVSPKYTFTQIEENLYRIENELGLCLTADTKETQESTHLSFTTWQSSDSQKWEILKAPEKVFGPVAGE